MVQKALLNNAPGGLGVPNGASPGGAGASQGHPGDLQGSKRDKICFLVESSVPKYHHAGPRDGVIRCQTALWSGLLAALSLRPPGFCTWVLQ